MRSAVRSTCGFWTAGFDVIYACQDFDFDRETKLFSIPSRIGIGPALQVARFLHLLMIVCLIALAVQFELGMLSLAGIGIVTAILIYEHSIVRPDDFSRLNMAFFNLNGYVSFLFFLFWAADIFMHRPVI